MIDKSLALLGLAPKRDDYLLRHLVGLEPVAYRMRWLNIGILVGAALAQRDNVIDLKLARVDPLLANTTLALMELEKLFATDLFD